MAGRPTKLTPDVAAAIVRRLGRGLPLHVAAALAGVGLSSVRGWVRRGEGRDQRPPSEPYVSFAAVCRQAVARACEALHDVVLGAATGAPVAALSVNAAKWSLARRFPEDYGSSRERRTIVAPRPPRPTVTFVTAAGPGTPAASHALDEELVLAVRPSSRRR
jgi:hypothetical protein